MTAAGVPFSARPRSSTGTPKRPRRACETYMLKEIHEQADAVAETIADRTARPDGMDLPELDDELLIGAAGSSSSPAAPPTTRASSAATRSRSGRACRSRWTSRPSTATATPSWVPATWSSASRSRARRSTRWPPCASRERGASVLAVTNIMGSQATRAADGTLFTRAGLEIGVAATKTFTAQVAAMYLLALRMAELRGTLPDERALELVAQLKRSRTPSGRCSTPAARSTAWPSATSRRSSSSTWAATSACRSPRGRAQAQGDLLHRDRRVRGGGDEARSDRAARRGHAGLVVATDSPVLEKVISNMQEVRSGARP